MASTVDEVIAKFRVRYPSCSTVKAQDLFADAHRRLLSRVQVRNKTVDVSLVAGQAEYDLDSTIFKIHSAYFFWSASNRRPLTERSTDENDVMRFGWRSFNNVGDPYEYWVTSEAVSDSAQNAIGFLPTPGTTTASGYPKVTLYCTQWAALTGAETVPANLLDDNFYIYDMYAKWCAENDPSQSEYWEGKAERQIEIERQHVQDIQSQGTTGIISTAIFMPTRIR